MLTSSWLMTVVFLVVVFTLKFLIPLAPRLELMAHPGGHRRHAVATPLVGGVALFAGLVSAFFLTGGQLPNLFYSLIVVFCAGLLDDRFKLPSWVRFLAQGLALWLMVIETGVHLQSLGSISANGEVQLGGWSLAMTLFAGIGVINALNMSDGMDGLAASLTILVLALLVFVLGSTDPFANLLLVGLLAFLIFNLRIANQPARAFLGDSGSTLLGLVLAYLLIKYSQGSQALFAPVSALWFLSLPLFDAVAVLLIRPLRGKSPFAADRIHYHHLLLRQGLSVQMVLMLLITLQATSIALGLLLMRWGIPEHQQLWLFLAIFACYLLLLFKLTSSAEVATGHSKQPSEQSPIH